MNITILPDAPGAVTEQPTRLGKCERCKTTPIQRIDRKPGAIRCEYLCKCKDRRPKLPLRRKV